MDGGQNTPVAGKDLCAQEVVETEIFCYRMHVRHTLPKYTRAHSCGATPQRQLCVAQIALDTWRTLMVGAGRSCAGWKATSVLQATVLGIGPFIDLRLCCSSWPGTYCVSFLHSGWCQVRSTHPCVPLSMKA
jgi:hypothetical protein